MVFLDEITLLKFKVAMSEWELAVSKQLYKNLLLDLEKSKPEYEYLFSLVSEVENLNKEVSEKGSVLLGVQEDISKKLDMSLDDFQKYCSIDSETGRVFKLENDT